MSPPTPCGNPLPAWCSSTRVSRFANTTPTAPASNPSTLNSTLKVRTIRIRVAPSVFSTTASRMRRKRVLAMLDARIMSPARMENPASSRTTKVIWSTTLSMRANTSATLITVIVG